LSKPSGYPPTKTARRIWHTPGSRSAWFWFCFSLIYCATFYGLYIISENAFELVPWFNPVYHTGPAAYLMVLAGATYSLRARFMRNLPGKAQNWLWMHTWIGIGALLIAGLHENFIFVLYGFCFDLSCITGNYLGMLALYSLIFIVGSGIIGRLLDRWQAHVIAQEANTNGVGIAGAVRSRLLEMEYGIERLCAGKSDAFKQYCIRAMHKTNEPSQEFPSLMTHEQADFRRAYDTLHNYVRLKRSLAKQEHARRVFRSWRIVHMALVPLALVIMTYHGFMELKTIYPI
jgi:hypothetical protein